MQSLCRADSMAQVFFLLDIFASALVILGLLGHLDFGLAGVSGDLAGPCQCLAHFFTVRWRIILRLDDQISNRRIQEEFSLSFSLSTPLEWDTVQIKVTDIRYLCPLLTKAHEMISFEKDFELACILYSRIFWSFCWLVQSNGKPLRLLSCCHRRWMSWGGNKMWLCLWGQCEELHWGWGCWLSASMIASLPLRDSTSRSSCCG